MVQMANTISNHFAAHLNWLDVTVIMYQNYNYVIVKDVLKKYSLKYQMSGQIRKRLGVF